MFKVNAPRFFQILLALMVCAVVPAWATTATGPTPKPAYPPSCIAEPPLGRSSVDPNAVTKALTLYSYNTTSGNLSESGSVTVWRQPCSGGTAATILEIDRDPAFNGSTTQYFLFPEITLSTSSTSGIFPRFAREPNTTFEDTGPGVAMYYSTAYVLEYYDSSNPRGTPTTDYTQAFTVNIDNLAGGSPLVFDVPAYAVANPPPPVEISGYMSTAWTNPDQSHEGMFLQVYTNGDNANRVLAFAWYTYDELGAPFWLYGQSDPFPFGTSTVTAPTAYYGGGYFAPPAMQQAVPQTIWGSVTFSFPDCNTMSVQYDGDASAVGGPTGSDTRTFQRIATTDGLTCS
jgi:hypothetical protein